MKINFKKYNELIISSGGNKGVALLGSLNYINTFYPIHSFSYLTGCSVGSIIVLLINLGYSINELNEILFKINFSDFQECKIMNLIEKCGFDEGIKLTNFIKALIINKNYNQNITFLELFDKTKIKLTIVVTNITTGNVEYHNYIDTPDIPIYLSIRMSSNIPILFSPIIYNKNYYVDGALLEPFPYYYNKNTKKLCLWLFDKYEIDFLKKMEKVNFINELDNSFNYILNILRIIYINYMKIYYRKIDLYTNNNKKNDIIQVDFELKNVSFENFEMSFNDKIEMYNIGYDKCKIFYKKYFKKLRKRYLFMKYYYLWKYKVFMQ